MSTPQVLLAGPTTQLLAEPSRRPGLRRRLALTVLAVVAFVAAVLVLGPFGLIPFGLLLAFSTDSDEALSRRSVRFTPRNLGLAAAMMALSAWFWLWHLELTPSTLVAIAGALIAMPLALQDSAGDAARDRTFVVTKRSLILAIWGLVTFVYLYYDRGVWPYAAGRGVCRPASRGGSVAGVGRSPGADRVRAAAPPASPGAPGPPGAGPERLAVLRAARWGRGRRWRALRTNRVLLDRRPVRRRDRGLRRGLGPAGGVGGRPSPARLPGHQRGRGPAVGLPRHPARPDIGPAYRCGGARLTTGRGVVRAQRGPQRPAQRPFRERGQRCRLPATGGERANPRGRKWRPAGRLRRASGPRCWRRPTDASSRSPTATPTIPLAPTVTTPTTS